MLTVSDTRTPESDGGGPLIVEHLQAAGHDVADRTLVRDDLESIRDTLARWIADPGVQVVITTGGTGVSRRDTTVEVVRRLLTYELEGFGELFRMLSYEQVRSAAMLSRAVAGLVIGQPPPAGGGDTFIFALPGSANAVETAMKDLIAPQLAHLVWEREK